tara:strand:- start:582 stop:920 length:339 start_codon:yes stop_codon:yes gene_type:complete
MIKIFCTPVKKEVEQFIHDCFNHYFDGRFKRCIDVDIIFKSKLEQNADGWCTGDTNEILIEINNTVTGKDLYRNIAHEIVHAKQFLRGETHSHELMELEAVAGENELVELYL